MTRTKYNKVKFFLKEFHEEYHGITTSKIHIQRMLIVFSFEFLQNCLIQARAIFDDGGMNFETEDEIINKTLKGIFCWIVQQNCSKAQRDKIWRYKGKPLYDVDGKMIMYKNERKNV